MRRPISRFDISRSCEIALRAGAAVASLAWGQAEAPLEHAMEGGLVEEAAAEGDLGYQQVAMTGVGQHAPGPIEALDPDHGRDTFAVPEEHAIERGPRRAETRGDDLRRQIGV